MNLPEILGGLPDEPALLANDPAEWFCKYVLVDPEAKVALRLASALGWPAIQLKNGRFIDELPAGPNGWCTFAAQGTEDERMEAAARLLVIASRFPPPERPEP